MEKNIGNQKISPMDRIIIPVDASPEMDSIIEKAFSLAKEMGRSVLAFYIIDTPRLTEVIPPDGLSTAWESLLSKEAQQLLRKFEQRGKELGIPVEKKIVEGIPENEIIKEARKNDLIVMGCKSQGFFDRLLTSNVCEKVIDKSSSSVMTYKMR